MTGICCSWRLRSPLSTLSYGLIEVCYGEWASISTVFSIRGKCSVSRAGIMQSQRLSEFNRLLINPRKDLTMGDKGGKKDKDKSKKQKTAKHDQKVKQGQDKNRPKS